MTSKLPFLHRKILKSCSKFVFLTKTFKEKNKHYVPKTFPKYNDYKHQNTQFL
jgi:hypothetical protein